MPAHDHFTTEVAKVLATDRRAFGIALFVYFPDVAAFATFNHILSHLHSRIIYR